MDKKIGIVCAGDRELAPFLDHIDDMLITEDAMLKIHEGTINGIKVVALYSGVCKVNAAIATQILIDRFGADIIINAGTAGGMDDSLEIFDTVISTEVAYHDVDPTILTEFHPWMKSEYFCADNELIRLSKIAVEELQSRYAVVYGRVATGEQFIDEAGRKEINNRWAPLIVDMETASIAHVCFVNKIPFISIRSITDTEKNSGSENFEKNCEKASVIAKDITIALLKQIRKHGKQLLL